MKKYEIVKSPDDFNQIINKGQKVGNKYIIFFYMPTASEKPKFGIAVGKKVGNAVCRNKLKRQMRVLIDQHKLLFKKFNNYIIMIKRECVNIPYNLLEQKFDELLERMTQ